MILHKIYFVIFNLKQNLWPQILFIYLKSFENKKKWWIDEFNELMSSMKEKKIEEKKKKKKTPNYHTPNPTNELGLWQGP